MGLVAEGMVKELPVNGLNVGILMALAQGQALVQIVEGLDAGLARFVIGADGLSAAADAAAGAGHDLDEEIVGLAVLDPADDLLGVLQAVDHRHLEGGAVQIDSGLLDAAHLAADRLEFQPGQFLLGVELIGGAQGGLHDAAGGAEDGARA